MIKEAYCSYKIARLIKEKGLVIAEHTKYIPMLNADGTTTPIATITHQTAMKWLRERNIGITPEVHTTQDPKDYFWGAIIFYIDKSWDILQYVSAPSKSISEGYDDVIEQALKYVLENLI